MAGPLSHIRVLDLSRILAGPFSAQILADLGADVIKVERPDEGDDTRQWGPPFRTMPDGSQGDAAYYLAANRGKRAVTADLATAEGQSLIKALAARSDIVIENFKAGGLAKYGLDYDSLRTIKPDLIYCSITGFGQDGPRASEAAYDFMIQAMGGLMSVTGEAGGTPQKAGVPVVDLMTGLYATIAVLAALARRDQTGEGEHIDIGLLDVMVGSLCNAAQGYLVSGKTPKRGGNRHPFIQPQDVFACRDGHIAIAVGNDGQYRNFCAAIGRPDLATDPRFASNGGRVGNLAALTPEIATTLGGDDVGAWVVKLERVGVPCAPINTVPDILADPQAVHRGMILDLEHPVTGMVRTLASPMHFRNAPIEYRRAPPSLGEHDDEIRAELSDD
jgi:crotonobetainyl-CoA:carnitine CoA-transferase CaiB-like acyl-CoA transferase